MTARTPAKVLHGMAPKSLDWLYWSIAAWVTLLVILPSAPAKYVLFAIFWAVYAYVLVNDPERTLLLVILGLPAMVFSPQGSGIPITGLNNHTIFVVTCALALFATRKKEPHPPPANPLTAPVVYFALLLIGSAIVSHLTSSAIIHTPDRGWHQVGLAKLFKMVKTQAMFPFLAPIAFRLLRSRGDLRSVVMVLATTATLVSLESLWELRHKILSGSVDSLSRNAGFVTEPNAFGGYLALVIALLVPLFVEARLSRLERILLGVTLGTAGVALLATLSRGSWLALIVSLVYVAVTRGAKMGIFLLVAALTLTLWMPQSVIDRVNHTIQRNDSWVRESFAEDDIEMDGSAEGRVEHWSTLFDYWAASPVYGHGFFSYQRLWNKISPRTGYSIAAHSTIIELTTEEGTLGFLAYFWLIWALVRGATKIVLLGRDRDDTGFFVPLASGMITATICLVILDASGARFKNPLLMANMWILAGGLARLYWDMKQEQTEPAAGRYRRRG